MRPSSGRRKTDNQIYHSLGQNLILPLPCLSSAAHPRWGQQWQVSPLWSHSYLRSEAAEDHMSGSATRWHVNSWHCDFYVCHVLVWGLSPRVKGWKQGSSTGVEAWGSVYNTGYMIPEWLLRKQLAALWLPASGVITISCTMLHCDFTMWATCHLP